MANEFRTEGIIIGAGTATKNGTEIEIIGHKAKHESGGSDEISIAGLSGVAADPQTPAAHHAEHENGGSDEISIAGLSGVAADPQTPKLHAPEHETGGSDILVMSGDVVGNLPSPNVVGARGGLLGFTVNGHPILADGYEVWDDARSTGMATSGPTATRAQVETYRGAINMRHWDTNEEAGDNWHLTHGWKPESLVYPHMHAKLRTGTLAIDARVQFELATMLGRPDAIDSAPITETKEFVISGNAQYTELFLVFDPLTMTDYLESANISFNLKRIAATIDEYGDKLAIAEIDSHILIQKWGTLTEVPGSGP